jgi:5'-3' exonuclease
MKYLLVDLSYFVFYRYYALVNYIHLSTKTVPDLTDVTNNKEFTDKYSKMFEKSLLGLLKTYFHVKRNKYDNIQVFMARDCSRCNIWRQKHFPEYKATRDLAKKKHHFDGKIFDYVYNVIIPNLLKKYPFMHLVGNEEAEADDVIAVITSSLSIQNNQDTVYIITNDHDYLQLLNKVTGIYNLQGKNLLTKAIDGCPYKSLLLKVLQGDVSDNIKGVLSKVKSVNLLKQCDTLELMDEHFQTKATQQQRDQYEFNKLMICFDKIPEYIMNNIISEFHTHTSSNCEACKRICSTSL